MVGKFSSMWLLGYLACACSEAHSGANKPAADSGHAGSAGTGVPQAGAADASMQAGRDADGGTKLFDCDLKHVLCERAPPMCPPVHVPSVSGSCFGDCVYDEACRCSEDKDCPSIDGLRCDRQAGHCRLPYI